MKLSTQTLEILQNFSLINNSIYLDEVGFIKTKSPNSSNVIAVAEVKEKLPEVAIYSLNELLGAISLLEKDETDFKFTKDYINISDKETKIKYRLSDPAHIMSQCKAAADYAAYDDFDFSFEITNQQLQSSLKAAKVLGADTFDIKLKDGKGTLSLINSEMPMSNSFEIKVQGSGDGEVRFYVDNLSVISGDYSVQATSNKVVKLNNNDYPLYYFISAAI